MADQQTILLIDDEDDILELYSTKLRQEGLNVITAAGGPDGLEAAKNRHPDLILLDLKMSKMDGAQILTKLKEDPATRDIKVVFLTAFSDPMGSETDAKYAKEIGATDYIKKGIGLAELVERVKQYLK